MNAWHQKYKDRGLVVIGIHTPEWERERSLKNVTKAVAELGIEFPVALDNDYAAWKRFKNEYWPAYYLIDPQGRIVYSAVGEHDYRRTEERIRQLLDFLGN